MIDQEELHKQCLSEYFKERIKALDCLKNYFSSLPDRKQAWDDLHRLTNDEDIFVRSASAFALYTVFSHELYKQQAWEDLDKLINDEDSFVRSGAACVLGSVFFQVPDKQKAWNDLHRLIIDKDSCVRYEAVSTLDSLFPYVPDKQKAWNDLIKLTTDETSSVRSKAACTLGSVFSYVLNKQKAWNDLHILTNDDDSYVRYEAANTIDSAFSHIPEKQRAWRDLIKLTNDKDSFVRSRASSALSSVFTQVPDKQKAWNDLHLLIDENSYVRSSAVSVLGSAFFYLPDKQQAWYELIKLISDKDSYVRSSAASVLGSAFPHVPDQQQAWSDLIKLTTNEDLHVRSSAAFALGSSLSYMSDKQKAWNELIELTSNEDSYVKSRVISTLGSAFPHVPDKQQAWNDLIKLTKNKDKRVEAYANHSLGKVCIFKASQAEKEDDYKKELEEAIIFFEKAASESQWNNPAQFCLPFYRFFHAIVFEKQEAKGKMDKYLAEAKDAVRGSKSRELLFGAVDNLAHALKEVQSMEILDLEVMKDELSFYKIYCDRAVELMRDSEETAPFAIETMRKGMPIIDRNLKGLIKEVQEKAKAACQISKGTPTQEIACAVNKEVQKWEISNQEEMAFYVESFIFTLKSKIPRLPENELIFKIINESIDQKDLNKLLGNASKLIKMIPEITIDFERMKPTIGIITALPKEYAAVNILLENKNDKYTISGSGAGRRYCLGEISSEERNTHYIVLTTTGIGNNIAATRASILLENFPNVKSIIMVGIAGGVPNPKKADDHVRLGDIVVSNENGVIQYDLIKQEIQKITHRNPPRPPSASLLDAVKYLEAEEILGNRPWEKHISEALSKIKTHRPSDDKDILYNFDNRKRKIKHPQDPKRLNGQPRIFSGSIASANILQKDPKARDKLRDMFGIKAIEMEASGIADATWNHAEVGYLVVRGICDYCDSNKNDDWQQYAAVVAAAYTRALIESMP